MPFHDRARAHPDPIHPAPAFAAIFVVIFLLHVPLLQLPYFWDEAGYYVPAARDLLLTGSLIPHTTVSNAHPPLVLAWVALWWKVVGFAPVVTRSAMLMVAAFSLLGVFRLAACVANTQAAIASTLCTALYPVFFAQSSFAQVDLAAAGLTFWGLVAYIEHRPLATVVWFSLAALAKETAILAPVALAGWEVLGRLMAMRRRVAREHGSEVLGGRAALQGPVSRFKSLGASAPVAACWLRSLWLERGAESTTRRILPLLAPLLPLALWYTYHWTRTGYVFGNPEFFRYNVAATLNPLRFLLALVLRLWQAFGYMHLWLLTLAMVLAMLWPPLQDEGVERPRIAIPVQMIFFVVVTSYVVALSLIGGAELARYMLPAVPLVIILAVSTLRRRLRYWPAAAALVALAFVAAWFWNPPYGFSPEDNLAYRDYVLLHEDGDRFLEARYPMAHVLTAWPASDELTRPWLGYIARPMQIVRIEDFSLEEVLSAADFRSNSNSNSPSNFEAALLFSTKYEPPHPLLDRWKTWMDLKRKFFGFHRDLPPAAAAHILGGKVVFAEERNGQWIAVLEMEQGEVQNAESRSLSWPAW
ncbi:MAG TPA: glycosyltransferase [Candidatus Sulfotelmatobacter sp.]|jgi:hypothetical protein